MKITALVLALGLAGVAGDALAVEGLPRECFDKATKEFGVPPTVFATVIATEGCWPGFVGKNKNGSVDRGLMCINSVHDDRWRKVGITPEQLRDDACVSMAVGAFMLRESYEEAKHEADTPEAAWVRAISYYHSHNDHYRLIYQQRAADSLRRLMTTSHGK